MQYWLIFIYRSLLKNVQHTFVSSSVIVVNPAYYRCAIRGSRSPAVTRSDYNCPFSNNRRGDPTFSTPICYREISAIIN